MNREEAFEKWFKYECAKCSPEAMDPFNVAVKSFFAGWEAAEKQRNQSCMCGKCHEVACECNEQDDQ